MRKRYVVALLVESSNAYARELLRGISAYARETDCWSVALTENEPGYEQLKWFTQFKGDGVIARIVDATILRRLKAVRVPVIDVSGAYPTRNVSQVLSDDADISRLAIEHLRERGFTRVAFCGDSRFSWSRLRGDSFGEMARQARLECVVYSSNARQAPASWIQTNRRLRRWVRSLSLPIGVMASHDLRGQQLLDACRAEGIAVPEQLAIIGVDNDELVCDLCEPRLSSVIPDAYRVGYESARLLTAAMTRSRMRPRELRIPARGVMTRQSTDVVAIDDAIVAQAMKLVRHQACAGISVADIARSLDVSRGTLDSRFLTSIGRTPHSEIERIRIERIKQLLVETTLNLESIAAATGFRHAEYMNVAFKRRVGQSPGRFRARLRGPRHS